jgi:TetR/AcrR family transcriptional repressor of nem operon
MVISTYNKIIGAADKYIQKNGFSGFSYTDLAQEIGIKKASIHYYFPSKMDLGIAYCQFKLEALDDFEKSIKNIKSARDIISKYCKFFEICAENKEMCGIHAMLTDCSLYSDELKDKVTVLINAELKILENIFEVLLKENSVKLSYMLPSELAIIVNSTVKGSLLINRVSEKNTYNTAVESLIKMLVI